MRELKLILTSLFFAAIVAASVPAAAQTTTTGYLGGEVQGGGTISGKVTWKGTKLEIEPFAINKNPEVCDTDGSGKRPSNRLLVSENGGVANAVVYLEDIQQGKPLPTAGAKLDQKGCHYVSHITILPRKAELTLSSSDAILHNVHMYDAASYNIPFPNMNTLAKKMRKAGIVRIRCDAGHGWMSAYVFVVDHPYYALTDENGQFTLTDVPPGSYTIKMWHEHWEVEQKTEKDGLVTGYEFEDPIEQAKNVEVPSGGRASVDFELPQ